MPRSIHEPVGLVLNKREQMFTGLHWLVEMGTTEVILHSKFCSKLNQATKPGIKCGFKSHFLYQVSFGKSKGPHTRAGRKNLQTLKMINRQGLLTPLSSRLYKSFWVFFVSVCDILSPCIFSLRSRQPCSRISETFFPKEVHFHQA